MLFGVERDAKLSKARIKVRKRRQAGWTFDTGKQPFREFRRLPLGKVTALADPEKISDAPGGPAAEPVAYGAAATGTAAATTDATEEPETRRGCLGWLVDNKTLVALGFGGVLVLLVVLGLLLAGDDGGGDGDDSTSADDVAQADQGTNGGLPVDEYADQACGVFDDELLDADAGFQESLSAGSGARVATRGIYESIQESAVAFSTALTTTADRLQKLPPPAVEGGEAAHEATIADYRAAAEIVAELAAVAGAFDPTTATQAENVALGEEVNRLLTDLSEALGPGPEDVAEINAAFARSGACAQLRA